MQADEQQLLLAIANSPDRHPYVRAIVRKLGINQKRAAYLCLKWEYKGWYDYGVHCLAGWLTPEGKRTAAAQEKAGEQGCG